MQQVDIDLSTNFHHTFQESFHHTTDFQSIAFKKERELPNKSKVFFVFQTFCALNGFNTLLRKLQANL